MILGAGNRDFDDDTFWRVRKRSEVALRYGAGVEKDVAWRDEVPGSSGEWRVERPDR